MKASSLSALDFEARLDRRPRPSHICLLALLFFVTPAIQQGHASGLQTKSAVLITADPHYRLLKENEQVRVYSLVLPPGAESFVRHEHNYLTVTLADCNPILWKNDESPIQHFQVATGELHFFLGGLAHGIRNDSNAEYRNVTVEFLDPQVTNYGYRYESGKYDYGPVALNAPVDPEGHFVNSLDLEKTEAKDVQLLPQQTLPAARGPQLLIAITALNLSAGADRKISLHPGDVLWRESPEPALANTGPARARFAVVEFKTTSDRH
ncbi:MAG TPA: hypothetical protein VNZ47_17310 [Candidatus Dormibacteraeota bacterium]|jgi:hypothetical protein|nr:hypothetical protein [Candidatus Dormibacteraeota bacterium]